MKIGKKLIMVVLYLLILVGFTATTQANKSVFIISRHNTPSRAQAYSIEGDEVVYQADVDISTYNPGIGAVANAIWPEKELMFVTYEGSDMLVWSSTKTLEKVGEYDTGINDDFAGIVVDQDKELIYAIRRNYEDLYVYSFDESNNTLVLEGQYDLETLTVPIDGWGLALDEENDLLYVTDESKTVHYYDTNDWSLEGSIDISVSGTDRRAVGIAVDPNRGYMYTGAFHGTGGYHQYLVRTELNSPYTSIETNVGQEAIGLAVDEDTGYVYVTTDHDDFRVYDPNLTLLDTEDNAGITSPAGVAIGGWYKTPSFLLVKDNNDPNDDCVQPWNMIDENYLTFDICWDANGHADTNVVLIDYLPKECDYYSSDPNGDYNSTDHTVTWDLEDIGDNDANCFELKTKVNYWARPGDTFTNLVVMEGDTYRNDATDDCNVCVWGGEIIYVDEDANGFNNGTSWLDAYDLLQDGLTGARNCGAAVTSIWVAAGTYKPVWQTDASNQYKNESFELIEDIGLFGHFAGTETKTSQRNFVDPNNKTILDGQIGSSASDAVYDVVYADNIEDAIVDGFTITGSYAFFYFGAGIYLNDANVAVVNCKLKDNYSQGIKCYNSSCPDIHNCTFINNTGGGLYAYQSSRPEVSYCVFDGNDVIPYGIYMENYSVVDADNCVFRDHTGDGIYAIGGTLTIADSAFKGNNNNGILASNCDLTIDHSVIVNNEQNGLYTSNSCNLTIKRSVIRYNGYEGVELRNNSTTTVTNNWIHNNGTRNSQSNGAGIYLYNPGETPFIRNNTIYDNYTYGIEMTETDSDPNILNCIIYGNDTNDLYRQNGTFDTVNYCLLQVSRPNNITGDPCFVDPDSNDLHVQEYSVCKNAGDPNGDYGSETDIDGEDRICYGRVDIGADEYYWSKADYDESGYVDFIDYAIFADAWQTEDANITLDDDNDVDTDDLALFCKDWLWEKAWEYGWMMCMGGGCRAAGMDGGLMLPDAKASLAARPERLIARTQKFYDLTPDKTITALRKAQEVKKVNIEEIVEWLEYLWLTEEDLREYMTEAEWLEFIESVKSGLE